MRAMGEIRTQSEGHFEMLWDCEHCGTKGLLGLSQRYCAECGAPQNPDKRYFPKEGEAKIVDGHRYDGADRWLQRSFMHLDARRTRPVREADGNVLS